MAFCGKCGTQLNGEKFCPKCGALNESMVNSTQGKRSFANQIWKKAIVVLVVIAIGAFIIPRFMATVNEPCDWCGDSPSVAYKLSDGSYAYVCKECSKNCALCGEKASKHYENLLGMIVFVCDDCYEDVQQYQ